jgi:hypothetical protein
MESGRWGPDPRQPAWKAGGCALAARLIYIGLTAGFIRYMCIVSVPGKTCHVFLPAISAKNVAPISGQAVTLLDTLYLIPSSLARLSRKEVLIPSPVVMGFAQTDLGNLSARIRLPRFASVDYTGFLLEEHNAERNYGHVGRSKGVPNSKQRSAGHGTCRFSFPAVLPETSVAANESCTYNIHTAPHERKRMSQSWKLVGPDGKPYTSAVPGTLGGHRRSRIYGRRAARHRARRLCHPPRLLPRLANTHGPPGTAPAPSASQRRTRAGKHSKPTGRGTGQFMWEDGGRPCEPEKCDR